VFYYGTIGYLDPILFLGITLGFYFILKRSYVHLYLTIFLFFFVKESIILLLPLAGFSMLANKVPLWKIFISCFSVFLLYVVFSDMIRFINPIQTEYFWQPSLSFVIYNLRRVNTFISFFLSFGIPGTLAIVNIHPKYRFVSIKKFALLYFGFILSIALSVYALVAAYSDGRFIWMSYPFTIPISCIFISEYIKRHLPDNNINHPQQHGYQV
jgi:hypothetical protein